MKFIRVTLAVILYKSCFTIIVNDQLKCQICISICLYCNHITTFQSRYCWITWKVHFGKFKTILFCIFSICAPTWNAICFCFPGYIVYNYIRNRSCIASICKFHVPGISKYICLKLYAVYGNIFRCIFLKCSCNRYILFGHRKCIGICRCIIYLNLCSTYRSTNWYFVHCIMTVRCCSYRNLASRFHPGCCA